MSALLPSIIMTFLAGLLLAFQSPINARLGDFMGGPLAASLLSFLTGTVALGALMLVARKPVAWANIPQTSAWMWIGGLLGAFLVFTAAYAVPRLGAAALIALMIAGQVLASIAIDHFGVMVPQTPVSPIRIGGAVLLLIGVMMILYPKFG